MPNRGYTVGKARRFVAGNFWCAQKRNQGKLPCLLCRGRGTLPGDNTRVGCPDCGATGHNSDQRVWMLWLKFWIYIQVTGKGIDSEIFHS